MQEKELSKYYWLKKEVADLENRLKEFGYGVKSMQINDISVTSSHINKTIQDKRIELIGLLTEKRISALEEYIKIERYIEEVEDAEIRTIMRYRFLDLKKWSEIDKLLHNGIDYSKKKYYKYNKISHTIPSNNGNMLS